MLLETERLILRPFEDTDAAAVYQYAKDERIGPIAGWPPHQSAQESLEIIQTIFAQDGVFAITLKADNIAIGMISLIRGEQSNFPISASEGEISYWLGVPFWGQGIVPEAIREVLHYGFEELRLIQIWTGYYADNNKSQIAQEKCGFRYHHRKEITVNEHTDAICTEHISRITRDEWTMTHYGKVSF